MAKFKWKDADQVAALLGYTGWTDMQYLLLENYIQHGVRPEPDGCLGCDAAFIRTVTGEMDAYAQQQ